MGDSTPFPSSAAIKRAERFTRERFVFEGETAREALAPGSVRRNALDAALADVEAGLKVPSIEWRQEYSLLLGLERLLSEDEPKLVDGTVLSAHQVDALSGTLTALLAAAQTGIDVLPGERAPDDTVPEELNGSLGLDQATVADADAGDEDEIQAELEVEVEGEFETEDESEDETELEAEAEADEEAPDEEPQDWQHDDAALDEDISPEGAADDPGAGRRFWFEHATGAGKTVAAVGFVEASRTGGVLILTHRRNLVDQFIGELKDRGYRERLCKPLLVGEDAANGPVTVETYQWFVRNAGKISGAYTIVICDEAHTALGEKTSAAIRQLASADLDRHDRNRGADRPARHRSVPDADLALRSGPGRPPRRDRAAALHPHPAWTRCAHDRQGAAPPRRGRHRIRPGDAGRAARPDTVQPGDRRSLQDPLQRRPGRRLRRRRQARLQRRRVLPRPGDEGNGRLRRDAEA